MNFSENKICFSAGVFGEDLEFAAEQAKKAGIKRIELDAKSSLAHLCRGDIGFDAGIAESIREKFDRQSIRIVSVLFRINLAAENENVRRADVKAFVNMTAYAKALGAELICTDGGTTEEQSAESAVEFERLAESFHPIISRAECRGVNVAVTVEPETVICSFEKARRLSDMLTSDRLGFSARAAKAEVGGLSDKIFAVRICAEELTEERILGTIAFLKKVCEKTKEFPEIIIEGLEPRLFNDAAEMIKSGLRQI